MPARRSDGPPDWVRRYTASRHGFPAWAAASPDRLAMVSNRGGSWQAWAHDREHETWRQASEERIGVEEVHVAPDGRLVWFSDDTGAETGRWVAQAFEGGTVEPLAPGLPAGWPLGISFAGARVAVGLEVAGEYLVYVVEGDDVRLLVSTERPCGVGSEWPAGRAGLSPDGRFLVVRHTEHGDILRPAIRIMESSTGAVADELDDTPRKLDAAAWSSDQTLAITNELGDRARPSLWHADGTRQDLAVDLPGDVLPVEWFPDGTDLLVRHELEGRAELHRLNPATGSVTRLAAPGGDLTEARIRPDGDVWFLASDSATPARVLDLRGGEPVVSHDELPPAGRRYRSRWVANPSGDPIHAFVVEPPDATPPYPLVLSVHGGPEWHERDAFEPETQAFVDAGYAVALPNYRGSTGYGRAHREALIGDVCWTESEDLLAVLDALVADGTADPDRVFWSGWSWGGCLACFNAGVSPDRFRAIFAGIPAGDFVAAHRASAPELQAWDRAVYGGSPDEVPDSYSKSDPMTYVGKVRSPTIVIAGERDPRCPIEGVTPWVDAVRANGTEVEVHLYPAGHHANEMRDQVAHLRLVLAFFARHGGVPFEG